MTAKVRFHRKPRLQARPDNFSPTRRIGAILLLRRSRRRSREARAVRRRKAFAAGALSTLLVPGADFPGGLVSLAGFGRGLRGLGSVMRGGASVGRTTSGGFGWRTGKSLALAMVRPDCAEPGTELEIRVLGEPRRAVVVADSPFDPENKALRG